MFTLDPWIRLIRVLFISVLNILFFAIFVMIVWNWVMPVLGLVKLTYLQSFALLFLTRLLLR